VVLLIAAVGGYLWYEAPLKSSRPHDKGLDHEISEEGVPARLWQDPFQAIELHRQSLTLRMDSRKAKETISAHEEETFEHTQEQLLAEIEESIQEIKKKAVQEKHEQKKILALPVILDGSPYQEGTELRIRDRIAVLSALGRSCFVPKDNEHIRYVWWRAIHFVLPYEWFDARKLRECRATEQFEKVLVLWMNNEALAKSPS
jgi:hypothetical protein